MTVLTLPEPTGSTISLEESTTEAREYHGSWRPIEGEPGPRLLLRLQSGTNRSHGQSNEEILDIYKNHPAYKHRIEELRSFAAEDDDCPDINGASEKDFWSFIEFVPRLNKAALFLLDNGNLRAVWKGRNKTHVGVQFLGEQDVRYVIFKRRPASRKISRESGSDSLEGMRERLHDRDLQIALMENV